jgi:hypothetical protein
MPEALFAGPETRDTGRRSEWMFEDFAGTVVDLQRQPEGIGEGDELEHAATPGQRVVTRLHFHAGAAQPFGHLRQLGGVGYLITGVGKIVGIAMLQGDAPGTRIKPVKDLITILHRFLQTQPGGHECTPGGHVLHCESHVTQTLHAHCLFSRHRV